MAVQNSNDNNKNTQGPAAAFGESFSNTNNAQASGPSNSRPATGNLRGALGLRGADRLNSLRTGVGRKRVNADLAKMQEVFMEEFASFTNSSVVPEAQNFKLIMVDRNRLKKKVDALVAVLPVNKDGRTHAAIYTMLLEDSNDKYEPVALTSGGQTRHYSTTVGDVYGPEFWGTISQIVSETSGLQVSPVDAGHFAILAETDITDKDVIHRIAFFASEALTRTALNAIVGSAEDIVSLAALDENTVASATIDFRNVPDSTALGLPLKADFDVKLRYSQPAKQGETQTEKAFDLGSSMPLGGAQGFVDLSYREPAPAGFGQPKATQLYDALVILTRLDTEQDFITPELQLLSLAGSTLISRNLNWARVWSPQFRGPGVDLNDLGAIGYELRVGEEGGELIDTTTAAFGDVELAKLVQYSINPKPVMMIDVEEAGELGWLNSVLIEAAAGSVDANRSIVAAADNLTDGAFSRLWHGSTSELIIDDGNRIHLGYYIDHNGDKRDIRDLNYLSVLNRYGASDGSVVVQWQETFDNQDIDAEFRLANRESLIRKILGSTVRITGYARRLVFAPDLLDCLLDACGEAGLRIRPENTLIGFGASTTRGRASYSQLGYGGNGGRTVYSYGGGAGGGRGFSRQYVGARSWRGQ